ncbi:MAG: hypothetical protein JWO67_794 [Streptosporangiaceae bacterium]|nr:hypothetical protein [Streptosporangiaceae bacterium]
MSGPERGALFVACETLPDFDEAVTRILSDDLDTAPIPVWSGGRTGLLDGIALAEQVYDSRRAPAPSTTGVVVGGPLPEPLRRLAEPLAHSWVPDVSHLPDSGSVLLIGAYADLRADAVQEVIDRAHAQGRALFVLTGRDVHTLSWMVAKQYGKVVPHGEVGMISELDTLPPVPGTVWLGAEEVRHQDVQSIALGRIWSRVLFHGNGKDDQLNLGQFTLCGLSPAGERQPGADGPKCAYGLGCPKPEDKLIPARRIRAAELVLGNCFSGPLADHAMYDPKYVILLDALDGPAQTVVATLTACDAQRPENLAWLTDTASRGSAAGAINERLTDINPYPSFVQIGLQSSGLTEQPALVREEADAALHTLGARLSGLLDSGLLNEEYPLRPRLRQLADTVLRDAVRTVLLSPPDGGSALSAIAAETKSLDLALAQRLAKHHDDPVLQFPMYFGERSVAEEPVDLDWPCTCGRPLRSYTRRGRVPVITDTVQAVCARCGDVVNSHVDAPELRVKSADRTAPGGSLHIVVEAVPRRAGTVNIGIVLPMYLNARVRPVLRRAEVRAGEIARGEFEIEMAPEATPQAYYFIPYAVQDLGISTRRVHFTLAGSPTP